MRNARSVKGFLCIAVVLLSVLSIARESTVTRTFKWHYNERTYSLDHTFDYNTYTFYKGLPRTFSNYAEYVVESSRYPFIEDFAKTLKQLAKKHGLSNWETINLIVKFVQSIPYVDDPVGEYPRFPIETLVDLAGDCEDSAILLAAILSSLGYEVLLVSPPGHMAVALACPNCNGTYYAQEGKRYFYIETTDVGWAIGAIPAQYQGRSAKVHAVKSGSDSGSMLARGQAPKPNPASSPAQYHGNGTVTINGVTYRVRMIRNSDGTWTY